MAHEEEAGGRNTRGNTGITDDVNKGSFSYKSSILLISNTCGSPTSALSIHWSIIQLNIQIQLIPKKIFGVMKHRIKLLLCIILKEDSLFPNQRQNWIRVLDDHLFCLLLNIYPFDRVNVNVQVRFVFQSFYTPLLSETVQTIQFHHHIF